jgi:hypothetical protein
MARRLSFRLAFASININGVESRRRAHFFAQEPISLRR